MTPDRELGRALLSCVAEHDWSATPAPLEAAVSRGRLDPLADLAGYHRALNFLYLSLKPIGSEAPDPEIVDRLATNYAHRVGHHMRALADLQDLGTALSSAGVPWLAFKGPVLSEAIYDRNDLRTYEDLDILVPADEFAGCIDALESGGFRLLDKNWDLIRRERRGQLHLVLRLGTVADVHWHLVNVDPVRTSFAVTMGPILERARTVRVGTMEIRTFDPADTLVHLALHAGLSGGDRLIHLKDVERTIAKEPVSWDEVITRARAWRCATLVGLVLNRAREKLGAPVPDEVVSALIASRSKRWVGERVDRRWPVECNTSRRSPAVLWSHSLRDTWPGTLRSLTLRLLRRPAHLTRVGRGDGEDGSSSKEVRRPTGNAGTRSEYLRGIGSRPD